MMLRLFLLTLLLTVKASELDSEGSGNVGDDEDEETIVETQHTSQVKNENSTVDQDDGSTTIIIVAAVSVVALAIGALTAVILFKRHLQRREQGVYSVPVEQGQKGI